MMSPRLRLLAATAVFSLVPTAWATLPRVDPCAGRDDASCRAPGLVEAPRITWSKGSVSAADGQKVGARVAKMLEVIQKAPLLAPKGMSLHPAVSVEGPPENAAKHHPLLTQGTLLLLPIDLKDKRSVQDKKTGTWKGTGEGPMLRLHLNDLGVFLRGERLDFTRPGQFFPEPRQVGVLQGFPVYDMGDREVLLIRKGDALPWRPFPVEEYFQHLIAHEEATLALFQKQMAAITGPAAAEVQKANAERQGRIDSLKQQLAQLTPTQRQAGACQSMKRQKGSLTGLDLECAPGSTRVVRANQGFFNPSAPKASLQLLAVTTTWGVLPKEDRLPNTLGRVLRAALEEVELKALQGQLD